MISRELMLNDWIEVISNDHLKYVQIKEIYQNSILTEESEYESEEIRIDNIKPIPLTPEILEKNGIVYDYDEEECVADYHYIKLKGYQYYDDDVLIDYCNGRIKIVRDITGSIEIEEIKYVHELQHALRLLGIEKTIEL